MSERPAKYRIIPSYWGGPDEPWYEEVDVPSAYPQMELGEVIEYLLTDHTRSEADITREVLEALGAERVPDGPRARALTPHGHELWLLPAGDRQ